MSRLLEINIDWADAFGYECPCCGGEIDHSDDDEDSEAGYVDSTYMCKDRNSELCESLYFMLRFSLKKRGPNGDALTLFRWIAIDIDDRYIVRELMTTDARLDEIHEATHNRKPTEGELLRFVGLGEKLLKRLARQTEETNKHLETLRARLIEKQSENKGE